MIEAKNARIEWLKNRNPELMSECIWRMDRMIKNADLKESYETESFDVTFNSEIEMQMFQEHIAEMGYELTMTGINWIKPDDKLKYALVIGFPL